MHDRVVNGMLQEVSDGERQTTAIQKKRLKRFVRPRYRRTAEHPLSYWRSAMRTGAWNLMLSFWAQQPPIDSNRTLATLPHSDDSRPANLSGYFPACTQSTRINENLTPVADAIYKYSCIYQRWRARVTHADARYVSSLLKPNSKTFPGLLNAGVNRWLEILRCHPVRQRSSIMKGWMMNHVSVTMQLTKLLN